MATSSIRAPHDLSRHAAFRKNSTAHSSQRQFAGVVLLSIHTTDPWPQSPNCAHKKLAAHALHNISSHEQPPQTNRLLEPLKPLIFCRLRAGLAVTRLRAAPMRSPSRFIQTIRYTTQVAHMQSPPRRPCAGVPSSRSHTVAPAGTLPGRTSSVSSRRDTQPAPILSPSHSPCASASRSRTNGPPSLIPGAGAPPSKAT